MALPFSKNRNHQLIFLQLCLSALIAGCSTTSQTASDKSQKSVGESNPPKVTQNSEVNETPAQAAIRLAFEDLKQRNEDARRPAEVDPMQKVGAKFEDLRASWEFIVFPKITNLSDKSGEAISSEYGRPIVFQSQTPRLLDCEKLVKEKINDLAIENFSAGDLKGSQCAVVRFFPQNPPPFKKDSIREVRVYLDSAYRTYGVDYVVQRSNKIKGGEPEVRRMKWDPKEPLSSGLSLFPTDLPRKSAWARSIFGELNLPPDPFVRKKIADPKWKASSCSQGHKVSYQDLFGGRADVGWCAGDPWPTTIENQRFFSILRRK